MDKEQQKQQDTETLGCIVKKEKPKPEEASFPFKNKGKAWQYGFKKSSKGDSIFYLLRKIL